VMGFGPPESDPEISAALAAANARGAMTFALPGPVGSYTLDPPARDPFLQQELIGIFIENVGNPVCPSSYDLGEDLRLVLLSVTEGEDKPLKYPTISTRPTLRS
jgi:hypothetical protein